jgi:outer membrane protein OmpA-like peptidoglycan-associated protein
MLWNAEPLWGRRLSAPRPVSARVQHGFEVSMKKRNSAWILSMVLVGTVGMSGCATNSYVKKKVAALHHETSQRLDQDDAKMADLDQTSKEALDRAKAAGKLAEGKFLYEMVLSDDSVKFPVDGSKLSQEAETRLSDLVTKLKSENKNVYLEIQGHTDATGGKAYNMKLGEQRAEAVRLFMNQQGVPLNRMSTISYGQDSPVAPNNTRAGRAQNRRVVVIVMA